RIWRDVAGAASHSNSIRTDELIVVVIARVVYETIAIPFLAHFVIELRIRKQSETEHAGGFAVNFLIDTGRLGLDLFIEPQTKFIRLSCRAKTGLVREPQSFEPLAAYILAVIEHFQKIHQAVTVLSGPIPKMLITAAPKVPGVPAHDFFGRQVNAAVHGLEDVRCELWEIRGR